MTTTRKPKLSAHQDASPTSAPAAPILRKRKDIVIQGVIEATPVGQNLVAHRAYELFQARGGIHGHDQEDWLQAELELNGLGGYR